MKTSVLGFDWPGVTKEQTSNYRWGALQTSCTDVDGKGVTCKFKRAELNYDLKHRWLVYDLRSGDLGGKDEAGDGTAGTEWRAVTANANV